ncbi:MAG: hypothetical protein WBZ36_15805 [Candidatus Nitrosopolaris sp.]
MRTTSPTPAAINSTLRRMLSSVSQLPHQSKFEKEARAAHLGAPRHSRSNSELNPAG